MHKNTLWTVPDLVTLDITVLLVLLVWVCVRSVLMESSRFCSAAVWRCPLRELSFLLVLSRGCCHATQCGTYTLTHAYTSSNNSLLYEVPTDAMVTSSFWARWAEWCAKKMPWFLFFFPSFQTTLPRNLLKLNKWKPVSRQITKGVNEGGLARESWSPLGF